MKIKALTDIQLNKKKIEAGTEFEATDGQAELLFSFGWAAEVAAPKAPKEEAPKPKKTAAKKK